MQREPTAGDGGWELTAHWSNSLAAMFHVEQSDISSSRSSSPSRLGQLKYRSIYDLEKPEKSPRNALQARNSFPPQAAFHLGPRHNRWNPPNSFNNLDFPHLHCGPLGPLSTGSPSSPQPKIQRICASSSTLVSHGQDSRRRQSEGWSR
jgi:hypothetical protein